MLNALFIFFVLINAAVFLAVAHSFMGMKGLSQTDRAQNFVSLGLLTSQILIAFFTYNSTDLARRSLDTTEKGLQEQRMVAFEYLRWSATLDRRAPGVLAMRLVGTRRPATMQLKCLDVEVIPIYRNLQTNLIDDPDAMGQPRLVLSCNELRRSVKKNEEEELEEEYHIPDLVDLLKRRYDGKPELAKIISPRFFGLHSIEIRLKYWPSASKDPLYALEGRSWFRKEPVTRIELSEL